MIGKVERDLTDINDISVNDKLEVLDDTEGFLKYIYDCVLKCDISNFNFIIFNEDIDSLSDREFLKYYDGKFQEILQIINEYVYISLDIIDDNSIDNKRKMVKNIITFFLNTLPYTYLKTYLNKNSIESIHEAISMIDISIQDKLIDSIHNNRIEFENFGKLMVDVGENINNDKKKNIFDGRLKLLENNMDKKLKLLQYHENIIKSSSVINLVDLCKKYINQDFVNII